VRDYLEQLDEDDRDKDNEEDFGDVVAQKDQRIFAPIAPELVDILGLGGNQRIEKQYWGYHAFIERRGDYSKAG
jgi:hypothetical protein